MQKNSSKQTGISIRAHHAGSQCRGQSPSSLPEETVHSFSEDFVFQAGRVAYNAFVRWTGVGRERSKDLLLFDRIDVRSEGGAEKRAKISKDLNKITDFIVRDIPTWADLPTGFALSKMRSEDAKPLLSLDREFYITGLDRKEIEAEQLDWFQAIQAVGAVVARLCVLLELAGCVDLPDTCDLLAGICLMAGPVNQNDIGKQFCGYPDLLKEAYPDRDPTSLMVWTLKGKTITVSLGNEEQLLNPERKGALVDLRPPPSQV